MFVFRYRIAGFVLGFYNTCDCKKCIPSDQVSRSEKISLFWPFVVADYPSSWHKTSGHFDDDGSWNHWQTCSSPRDASCSRLRQILLVWSASVTYSSHPFCFVSGAVWPPLQILNLTLHILQMEWLILDSWISRFFALFILINFKCANCHVLYILVLAECISDNIFPVDMGNGLFSATLFCNNGSSAPILHSISIHCSTLMFYICSIHLGWTLVSMTILILL